MLPLVLLDTFLTPEGRKLTLHQRGERYFILLDGEELISTRAPGSERALAELGCAGLPNREAPRVLVGGLGFGYTLRAALAVLPRRAKVEVVEISPAVVRWNRERLPRLFGDTLRDPRVRIVEGDVREVVANAGERYDALLLDVDDGPDAAQLKSASSLYHEDNLQRLANALVPGGRLALWSASPFPPFLKRLKRTGFEHARAVEARGRGERGDRHTVFLGEKAMKTPS
jgi:spermidine synthase